MQEWEGDCQDVLNLIQGILPACKKTKKTSTNIAEQTLTSKQSKQYDKPGVEQQLILQWSKMFYLHLALFIIYHFISVL